MKIEKLSVEQEKQLEVYRDKWIEIGLSTEPADRKRAEAAIVEMYKKGGLAPPQQIIWSDSPIAQARAAAQVVLKKPTKTDIKNFVAQSVQETVYGQHDAHWLAFYEYFREVVGLVEETEGLTGLFELAKACGWVLPYENICWASERPCALRRDEQGRLHSTTQAALEYRDGWKIYAVHGTLIPAEWIEVPGHLTPEIALTWRNAEQRRVAVELLGWKRILDTLQPRVIDTDPDPMIGTLIEVDLPDSPGSRFLRVQCGTKREFCLPVPQESRTAIEAQAAMFDLDVSVVKNYLTRT